MSLQTTVAFNGRKMGK